MTISGQYVDVRHKRKAFWGNSKVVENRTKSLLEYFFKFCSVALYTHYVYVSEEFDRADVSVWEEASIGVRLQDLLLEPFDDKV